MLLGEIDVLTDLMRLPDGLDSVAILYFWSFILIAFFILCVVLTASRVHALK